jgi:four helix bundle protein
MPGAESPIFSRCYDLLLWLIPLTLKFPRQQRFVIAEATQRAALGLHERLIEASHAAPAETSGALGKADIELDKLRHYLRLCRDLDLISTGQYEHAAGKLAEIGRLLGGWRKSSHQAS